MKSGAPARGALDRHPDPPAAKRKIPEGVGPARPMETYLRLLVHAQGASPTEVTRRLWKVGFVPVQGNYDFVYDWEGIPDPEELIDLTEEVGRALAGCRVLFELETVNRSGPTSSDDPTA